MPMFVCPKCARVDEKEVGASYCTSCLCWMVKDVCRVCVKPHQLGTERQCRLWLNVMRQAYNEKVAVDFDVTQVKTWISSLKQSEARH